eukprot:7380127-Pyramimonas_sp.AAC.1
MPVAMLAADRTTVTRLANGDPAWEPWITNVRNSADIPAHWNAGCFNVDPFDTVPGQALFATAPR